MAMTVPSFADSINDKLAALENSTKGRFGISAINTSNNRQINYRANEIFPIGSTFKIFPISAILMKSAENSSLLQENITYTKDDLMEWAPITKQYVDKGMTVLELSEAAIRYSDSTATHLLIAKMGGDQSVISFARTIGDEQFRMDSPGAFTHTSTPAAMNTSLQKLTLGDALRPAQQQQLITWLKGNTTGNKRIRAGVPKGWVVADKTGSGSYGVTNDIAVLWPPKCKPIIVSIYYKHPIKDSPRRPDVIASATQLLVDEFSKTDQCIQEI